MLSTKPSLLQKALEQLEQATLDHAVWHDRVLGVISAGLPADPNDLAADAHLNSLFGQWYYKRAPAELREQPSFAMIGTEHEALHRTAAQLLRGLSVGAPVAPAALEQLSEASSRLRFALFFIRREIERALHSRDRLTGAHSRVEMLPELREWHAVARQPNRQCCICIMSLDQVEEVNATHGYHMGARALSSALSILTGALRPSDKVYRYERNKFLVRLSGADLVTGRTLITHARDAIAEGLSLVLADGTQLQVTASFGLAALDPAVDVLESIDRADQALMLAKTAGRNRLICWDPSVTTGAKLKRLDLSGQQA
jgi:diguanylate cyclase